MSDVAAIGINVMYKVPFFYQMQYMVKKFYVYNTAHGNMK